MVFAHSGPLPGFLTLVTRSDGLAELEPDVQLSRVCFLRDC